MLQEPLKQKQKNELIINHFILGLTVIFEALIKVLNLIIPKPQKAARLVALSEKKTSGLNKLEEKAYSTFLEQTTTDDLKKILANVDIFSNLSKTRLIDLILSNKEALKLIKAQRDKESLEKMTNQEIRGILKGMTGISRLKKSELIEIVLKRTNSIQ